MKNISNGRTGRQKLIFRNGAFARGRDAALRRPRTRSACGTGRFYDVDLIEGCAAGRGADGASAPSLPRFGRAFTLVELLVVIAIIAVLAALLLPAIAAATKAAKVKKARTEISQLVNAIQRYDTTYSRYPTTQNPGTNSDFTYGGTSYNNVVNGVGSTGNTIGTPWNTNNSEVIAILMDIQTYPLNNQPTPNSGHVKNTQQIKFLNAIMVGDTNSPGVGQDLVYRDPWGNPYIITIDLNYNETTQDAFYRVANVSKQTGSGAAGLNGLTDLSDPGGVQPDYEYHGGVMVWSLGPDGKADANVPANQGFNRDNILSWKE
jgi:prepilin-type N-terminal cleavage/methylation domain-containing protein